MDNSTETSNQMPDWDAVLLSKQLKETAEQTGNP